MVYKYTAVQSNVLTDSYRLVYDTPLYASSSIRLCHFSMRFKKWDGTVRPLFSTSGDVREKKKHKRYERKQ